MSHQEQYMQRCLDLAMQGLGSVAPNPMVGCVVVHNGRIIGEGYHEQYGKAHAEVSALAAVTDSTLLPQSILYVNLEPCSHFGKTPPCADLIVAKKVGKVVIGSNDPNPKVAGNGIKKLKEAGIEVVTGVLKEKADFLNRRFITFHTRHRPYIILKWAQSSDGFMAPAEPRQLWLSNAASKKLVHQWRSQEQAILVGRNTMQTDNPALNVRLVTGKDPVRITIDKDLSLSLQHHLAKAGSPLWVFNQKAASVEGLLQTIKIDFSNDVLQQVMAFLFSNDIQSLIVEGGPTTLQHFIETDLWDEARIFTAPVMLKEGKRSPVIGGKLVQEEMIEGDKLITILR